MLTALAAVLILIDHEYGGYDRSAVETIEIQWSGCVRDADPPRLRTDSNDNPYEPSVFVEVRFDAAWLDVTPDRGRCFRARAHMLDGTATPWGDVMRMQVVDGPTTAEVTEPAAPIIVVGEQEMTDE